MASEMICPACGLADQVEKVSTLYLVATELEGRRKPAQQETGEPGSRNERAAQILLARRQAQPGVEPLRRKLAPPSSGRPTAMRPVHPDLAVLAFSLIAPVFLVGIINSQAGNLAIVLAILAACYGLYFWKRRWLIDRYQAEQTRQRQATRRVERAVRRWMQLYYCERDESVFDPLRGLSAPVDQMMALLWQEAQDA